MWDMLLYLNHEAKEWAGIFIPVILPIAYDWYKWHKTQKSDPRGKGDRTKRST